MTSPATPPRSTLTARAHAGLAPRPEVVQISTEARVACTVPPLPEDVYPVGYARRMLWPGLTKDGADVLLISIPGEDPRFDRVSLVDVNGGPSKIHMTGFPPEVEILNTSRGAVVPLSREPPIRSNRRRRPGRFSRRARS